MAKNFPEVWIGRVENNLKTSDKAPWLDVVTELDTPVVTLGKGTATEKNIINIPVSEFEVQVLINNTTYPIALQSYDDYTAVVALDKYQTLVTTLPDDVVMGAAYDTIDNATKGHTLSLSTNKFTKAAHAIAPQKDAPYTPVITTSGADDGAGRKSVTRKDIIALKKRFDEMECPLEDRVLVLCSDHIADLLDNDQKFENQYYKYKEGLINDVFGFQVFQYIANPFFSSATSEKLSFGAVPAADDYRASFAFYAPNIAKKTGDTFQYFQESKIDPDTQTNRLNYRHYFIAVPKRPRYLGAIMSAKV